MGPSTAWKDLMRLCMAPVPAHTLSPLEQDETTTHPQEDREEEGIICSPYVRPSQSQMHSLWREPREAQGSVIFNHIPMYLGIFQPFPVSTLHLITLLLGSRVLAP